MARSLMNFIAVRQPPVHPSEQSVQGGILPDDLYVRRSLELERQRVLDVARPPAGEVNKCYWIGMPLSCRAISRELHFAVQLSSYRRYRRICVTE